MKNFEGFGLHRVLTRSLDHMKYTTPTPIQAQAIPIALKGRDVMGSAQTGTGKTAAFSIPLVEYLLRNERGTALVLTPTRELGKQVMDVMHQLLGPKSKVKTAFLIGGDSMHRQQKQLSQRPRLIVGTPGRINDHLQRRNLDLDQTGFLVLDEMDRMLDMGFSVQIDKIIKYVPNERQTLLFSATMPPKIVEAAKKYQDNPERIAVGSTVNPAKNIKQDIIRVDVDKKYSTLITELHARDGSVIIFVKTKRGADKMAKKLQDEELDAVAIHGDLQQRKRDRVIREFRQQQFRILVATDVVARGLDVPHIEHVINYDLPQVPEDYIHRIGRTARAGAVGSALCMISPQDGRKWHAIEMLMDPDKKSAEKSSDHKKGKSRRKPGQNTPYNGKKKRSFQKPGQENVEAGGKPHFKKRNFKKPDQENVEANDRPRFKKRTFKKSDQENVESSGKPHGKKHTKKNGPNNSSFKKYDKPGQNKKRKFSGPKNRNKAA